MNSTLKSMALAAAAALALALASTAAMAKKKQQHKHEHGAAKVDVAVDGLVAKITLESPSDGIFGFEHAPRDDKEKAVITNGMKTLRERATELFVFDAAKACVATAVTVKAGQETAMAAPAGKPSGGSEHNDIDADYTFQCKVPLAGSELRLGLLKVYPRIKHVTVQVISGATQAGAAVSAETDVIKL
jgi:hypothetical protein